jgi:hypothetical protein
LHKINEKIVPEETFKLEFQGYWRRNNINGIPDKSGIYCVYECEYVKEKNSVTLINLLYIGQSENVRTRIQNHEKLDDMEMYIRRGNNNHELCFTFAHLNSDRDRIEAAMIYKHKPPFNDIYRDIFDFDKTTIISSGAVALLNTNFFVPFTAELFKELFGE